MRSSFIFILVMIICMWHRHVEWHLPVCIHPQLLASWCDCSACFDACFCNMNVTYCSNSVMLAHMLPMLLNMICQMFDNLTDWKNYQACSLLNMGQDNVCGPWWDSAWLIQLTYLQFLLYCFNTCKRHGIMSCRLVFTIWMIVYMQT